MSGDSAFPTEQIIDRRWPSDSPLIHSCLWDSNHVARHAESITRKEEDATAESLRFALALLAPTANHDRSRSEPDPYGRPRLSKLPGVAALLTPKQRSGDLLSRW